MSDTEPAPASKPKRTATIVWAVLVLLGMLCFCGAMAGPKFASFQRRPPPVLPVLPDDAGP